MKLNYSEVYYSSKNTVLQIGRSPRENLKDIFKGDPQQTQAGSTKKRGGMLRDTIREDDEED